MKFVINTLTAAAIGMFVSISPAMAEPCGVSPLPACEVPEPSSLPLTILGIGIALLIARRAKK